MSVSHMIGCFVIGFVVGVVVDRVWDHWFGWRFWG